MKINYNIYILFLFISLSACPYKEVYKPLLKNNNITNGLIISHEIFFYNSHKGISTSDVGFKIRNNSDSIKKITFLKSQLINLRDTLEIEKIYVFGTAFPKEHVFNILPKKDTIVGLMFKGLERNFGDTIKIILESSGVKNNIFIYIKQN